MSDANEDKSASFESYCSCMVSSGLPSFLACFALSFCPPLIPIAHFFHSLGGNKALFCMYQCLLMSVGKVDGKLKMYACVCTVL